MKITEYFDGVKGCGVLATSDADGRVDAAVYARPHVMDDQTVGFVMADRLSHHNLQSNPHAAYLFMEDGDGYVGKRLFLTKIKEETGEETLKSVRRKSYPELQGEQQYFVSFKIDQVLQLAEPIKSRE